MSKVAEDSDCAGLLEVVRFENLSVGRMAGFLEFIASSFELLNHPLWQSLRSRLLLPVSEKPSTRVIGVHRNPQPRAPLDGIMAHLATKCGGNVADKHVVEVMASSHYDRNMPKNAADVTVNTIWESISGQDAWLRYNFRDMRLRVTHYSLRSHHSGSVNGNNPKSWVIEISDDPSIGQQWTSEMTTQTLTHGIGPTCSSARPVTSAATSDSAIMG
jgi:hypothetical protein